MTLQDILALAKQGYKPGDIKELISLAEEKAEPEPQPENNGSTVEENSPTSQENENHEEIPDKNSELEERLKALEAQNAELSKQLKAAQDANINRDHSGEYKPVDPIADLTELFRKG